MANVTDEIGGSEVIKNPPERVAMSFERIPVLSAPIENISLKRRCHITADHAAITNVMSFDVFASSKLKLIDQDNGMRWRYVALLVSKNLYQVLISTDSNYVIPHQPTSRCIIAYVISFYI
ncbi:hypothetical protein [Morganella morganii]|uniref:hypothetical protein n=1 Tax=Morganella morganii TaxID=582 RepID=UPI001BDA9DEE|nr:hypothetical protein [Morganella morganii]MBT0384676.1 hypothetical protein [Morganella morganii subsp. morganii]